MCFRFDLQPNQHPSNVHIRLCFQLCLFHSLKCSQRLKSAAAVRNQQQHLSVSAVVLKEPKQLGNMNSSEQRCTVAEIKRECFEMNLDAEMRGDHVTVKKILEEKI